jgi:hypothetical protein
MTSAMMALWLRPAKAFRPVAISYTTAPKAKMSLRASVDCPDSCSAPYGQGFQTRYPARSGPPPLARDPTQARQAAGSFVQRRSRAAGTCSGQHDIGGLEVAMAYRVTVCLREAVGISAAIRSI